MLETRAGSEENTLVYVCLHVRVVRTSSSSSIRRATLSRQSTKNGFIRFTTSCPWFGKRHDNISLKKKKKKKGNPYPTIRISGKDEMIWAYNSLSFSLSLSLLIYPFIYLFLSPFLTRLVHKWLQTKEKSISSRVWLKQKKKELFYY